MMIKRVVACYQTLWPLQRHRPSFAFAPAAFRTGYADRMALLPGLVADLRRGVKKRKKKNGEELGRRCEKDDRRKVFECTHSFPRV